MKHNYYFILGTHLAVSCKEIESEQMLCITELLVRA